MITPFYPTLVTDQFTKTVNFYEDFFGFHPAVEQEHYVFMQAPDKAANAVAIFDSRHPCVVGVMPTVQGVILNIASHDIKGMYEFLYMEGVEVYKEPGIDIHGREHFVIYDPNGVMVNVYHPVPAAALVAAE